MALTSFSIGFISCDCADKVSVLMFFGQRYAVMCAVLAIVMLSYRLK